MKKHFVVFYSPGTFFDEQTERPVDKWDVEKATTLAHDISECHGATPFGFQFVTRGRTDKDLDSKVIKRSAMYHLGGKIMSLSQVKKEMPDQKILIGNMENNGWNKIIININSWKHTCVFGDKDTLLDFTPKSVRGSGTSA